MTSLSKCSITTKAQYSIAQVPYAVLKIFCMRKNETGLGNNLVALLQSELRVSSSMQK